MPGRRLKKIEYIEPGGAISSVVAKVYEPRFAEMAGIMCRMGATLADLADVFGVSVRTVTNWGIAIPEFKKALDIGRKAADDAVERRLYERATGYSYQSEKIFLGKDGEVMRVPITEHVPPDTTAMIFWLKNRRPDEWRDRTEKKTEKRSITEIKVTFEHVER